MFSVPLRSTEKLFSERRLNRWFLYNDHLSPVAYLKIIFHASFQLYSSPSCAMNLVCSFIYNFLFHSFLQKNEIEKGNSPNGIQ